VAAVLVIFVPVVVVILERAERRADSHLHACEHERVRVDRRGIDERAVGVLEPIIDRDTHGDVHRRVGGDDERRVEFDFALHVNGDRVVERLAVETCP